MEQTGSKRARVTSLIGGLVVLVALATVGISIGVLYRAAFEEERVGDGRQATLEMRR